MKNSNFDSQSSPMGPCKRDISTQVTQIIRLNDLSFFKTYIAKDLEANTNYYMHHRLVLSKVFVSIVT